MPTGFAGWENDGWERKKGINDDFEVFSQSNREDWDDVNFDGKHIWGIYFSSYSIEDVCRYAEYVVEYLNSKQR